MIRDAGNRRLITVGAVSVSQLGTAGLLAGGGRPAAALAREDHLDLLVQLASADWHHKHEDVVSALGQLRSPAAVEALYHAAWWVPDYLDFDESRALAVKAIWALGGTPGVSF